MPCENSKLDLAERQVLLRDDPAGFLNYLHCFPVDILKVDRFVSRMGDTGEDAALEQTVVILSYTLGMDVVAEGGETAAQKAQLQILFSKLINNKAALLAIQP